MAFVKALWLTPDPGPGCFSATPDPGPGPGRFSVRPDPGAGQSPLLPLSSNCRFVGSSTVDRITEAGGRRVTKACFYGQPFGGLLGHWLPHFLANHDQTENIVDICLTVDAKDYKDMQPFQRSDAKSQLRSISAVKICSEDKTPMHCTGDNAVKKQGQYKQRIRLWCTGAAVIILQKCWIAH